MSSTQGLKKKKEDTGGRSTHRPPQVGDVIGNREGKARIRGKELDYEEKSEKKQNDQDWENREAPDNKGMSKRERETELVWYLVS